MSLRDWLRGRAERRRHLYRRQFSLPRDRNLVPEQPELVDRIEHAVEAIRDSSAMFGSNWWGVALLGVPLVFLSWWVGRDPAFNRQAIGLAGAGCLAAVPVLLKLRNVAFALPLAGLGVGERIEVLLRRVTLICGLPFIVAMAGAGVLLWRHAAHGQEPPGAALGVLGLFGLPIVVMALRAWFLLLRYGAVLRDIDAQLGRWSGRDPAPPERPADPFAVSPDQSA